MLADEKTGYDIIYDMLSSARSHKQLLDAVNNSIPLMKRYNIPGTVRAAFSIYNNYEDVKLLKESLLKVKEFFK